MELTPLLSCIYNYIACDRQCINIYNGKTEDFNIRHFYLYGISGDEDLTPRG